MSPPVRVVWVAFVDIGNTARSVAQDHSKTAPDKQLLDKAALVLAARR